MKDAAKRMLAGFIGAFEREAEKLGLEGPEQEAKVQGMLMAFCRKLLKLPPEDVAEILYLLLSMPSFWPPLSKLIKEHLEILRSHAKPEEP